MTAEQDGDERFAPARAVERSFAVLAGRAAQTVTFPQPGPAAYGGGELPLTATTDSGSTWSARPVRRQSAPSWAPPCS